MRFIKTYIFNDEIRSTICEHKLILTLFAFIENAISSTAKLTLVKHRIGLANRCEAAFGSAQPAKRTLRSKSVSGEIKKIIY